MVAKSPKKYSKFSTKVLKILLFVGVIPLLIISGVSLVTVVKTRLGNISELQLQTIETTSEKVEKYLDQKAEIFNLVIDLTPIPTNVSEIQKASLDFLIEGLKEEAGNVNEMSFVDKDGNEVVKRSEVEGRDYLHLKNISQQDDFKKAIAGEDYFGPVNFTLAGPVMRLASQIENRNREVIGVISAEIDLKPIENIVSGVKLGKQGFVYITDQDGNLITSSNKDFASQGVNLTYIPLVEDVVGGRAHDGLAKEDRYKNSLEQRVIFSGRPIKKVGWSIISEWPLEDAFAVVITMIGRFLLIILTSLILIVVFSLFFVRLVVKPVEILSKGADEISRGNFDYQINIRTGDELEKLGERFNKMISVLKENEELRDEFVFIAAHELRAPVTVIKGYLSMILEGDFGKISPETEEALKTTNNLNERLVKLVQDLLEVARSKAGKMEIEVEPTSIKENVEEVLKEFEKSAAKKGIKLVYKGLDKDIKVMADPHRLKEVITNLLDNAIKYTAQKGGITVSHEIEGKYLLTHIKDNGIGISKENLEKLFSKFYRIKRKETQDIEGTGLGLFICKEIVERMRGKIWAKSQLGKGSTFSFSLPLA